MVDVVRTVGSLLLEPALAAATNYGLTMATSDSTAGLDLLGIRTPLPLGNALIQLLSSAIFVAVEKGIMDSEGQGPPEIVLQLGGFFKPLIIGSVVGALNMLNNDPRTSNSFVQEAAFGAVSSFIGDYAAATALSLL